MKLKTDLLILFKNILIMFRETYLEVWQTYKKEPFAKTFNSDDENVLLPKSIVF